MATPPELTRIRVEDFKSDEREMVGKLAGQINRFFEQVTSLFNKNIDYDNLNRQLSIVNVKIDGSGNVINNPQVKYTLNTGRVRGVNVVLALNNTNPGTYPTTAPFLSMTFANGIMTIVNVTGLQNNSDYNLTLELIG